MSMTSTLNEEMPIIQEKPGAQLAAQRVLRDYSQEYVAGKLHLRVRIIELLEADDYENMPEPVFIKGYLRAYAKLLGVAPDPLLVTFNALYADEKKTERTLWQSSRQSNKAEYVVRWVTILLSLGVLVAVGLWWESSRENDPILPAKLEQQALTQPMLPAKLEQQTLTQPVLPENLAQKPLAQPAPDLNNNIRLTDLSKMRNLLSTATQKEPVISAQKEPAAGDD